MTTKSTCDVLVVGSGAAGLTAAVEAASEGLDVLVVEKWEYLGGTSAISGGWAWVPGSAPGLAAGDTREDIEQYIRFMAGESYDPDRVETFLDSVPETLRFLETVAGLGIVYGAASPDYQMDAPGAKPSGRAVTFTQADARVLGEDRLRLRPYYYPLTVFGYMPEIGPDLSTFLKANRSLSAFGYVQRKVETARPWPATASGTPSRPLPTWYYRRVGYLVQADTVADLGAEIGVPADALRDTLAEFNAFNADAEKGVDTAYARGSNWFHHFRGDPDHKPNPNLAPLRRAPYNAVRGQMGDLGTFAGLAVDEHSRVRTGDGSIVRGLYAVGTAAVSPFGGGYTGYGACIGPALVFGYAAGRDIANAVRSSDVGEPAHVPA